MTGGIYLIQNSGELVEMVEEAYSSEDFLQDLLARYPSLLAGNQINPVLPRRWLLVTREVPVPDQQDGADRWSVDHLFLDQDGVPTIVEVKRSNDTRIRREVVGQMLDYAANGVVYWPIDRLRALYEANCQALGLDPQGAIQSLLDTEDDIEGFWQKVKTNLQAGRVRMVFVADHIPPELQRVVEFLNSQMDPAEVLAIEIKQYVGSAQRTLVPRVIGQTVEAQQKKGAGGASVKQWDEQSLLTELATNHGQRSADVARQLLRWAEQRMPAIYWGKGDQMGSFTPGLNHKGYWHQVIGVWSKGSKGNVEVQFHYMKGKILPFTDEEMRKELLQRLNTVPGISLPHDAYNRLPNFYLSALKDEDAVAQFLTVLDWFVDQVLPS